MDYLSWFIKDETHLAYLENHIKKKKPDVKKISRDIRLICIVGDVEDRVKNACYAISNPIKIWTYTTIKHESGDVLLIPRFELDNTEIEFAVTEEVSENEILEEYRHFPHFIKNLKNTYCPLVM